jgi:hypothetical protein
VTSLSAPLLEARASFRSRERAESVSRASFVALCILSALAARLCYLARPFDSDGSMFIYMGRLVAEGGRFGHDLVDNKFPTVGLMTSACWRAFGATWPCYVILQTILSAASVLMLCRAARRHLGEHAALPTALFAVVYLNLAPAVFGGFQLETIQSFFAVLAASAALEAMATGDPRDAFLVGLAGGCGAMLKPTGVAVVAAFAVAICVRGHMRNVLKLGSAAAVGLAVPLVVALTYLIGLDSVRDLPALARQISRYAGSSAWDTLDLLKPLTVLAIAGFPFVVRGWVFRRDRDDIDDHAAPRGVVSFILTWLTLEAAGVVAQRRMYAYHFLVLAAPAALAFGLVRRRDTARQLAAALAPAILLSLAGAWNVLAYSADRPPRLAVSDYLAGRTSPGVVVWRDDAPRLLLETNLRSGSRYMLMFLFANWDSAPLEYSAQLLEDFDRTRPRYLVLPADVPRHAERMGRNIRELAAFPVRRANYAEAWRRIDRYAREHYIEETTLGEETVWRRK